MKKHPNPAMEAEIQARARRWRMISPGLPENEEYTLAQNYSETELAEMERTIGPLPRQDYKEAVARTPAAGGMDEEERKLLRWWIDRRNEEERVAREGIRKLNLDLTEEEKDAIRRLSVGEPPVNGTRDYPSPPHNTSEALRQEPDINLGGDTK